MLTIIGASGSGKSTLLRCLNHLEQPTSGEIYLGGEPVGLRVRKNGVPAVRQGGAISRACAPKIGMVFQQFNLWPHMTALQNVIEALIQVTRARSREGAQRASAAVRSPRSTCSTRPDEYPARLSGGQQQRVAIARALAMAPKVMLFDEATSSLDPELTGEVLEVMRQFAKEGMTMVVVTHEMGFAREVSDRVMFLHEGQIDQDGPPAEVFGNPKSERCRKFLSKFLG